MLSLALALILRAISPLYLPASPPHLLSTSTAALHPHDFVARFDGAMLLQLLQMPRQVTLG